MKTINVTLLIAGLFFFVISEAKETEKETGRTEIQYVATTLGGCNNDVVLKNDGIFMYVIDTCEDPSSCYQRCSCFYTFDFEFTYQGENNHKYKIVLFDPREVEPKTISEGDINNEDNATGISNAIVKQCKLYQNAPNPFSEKTEIKYFLPQDIRQASVCIFDMQGKLLKKLNAPTGENTLIIKGSELHAGMYLYSPVADGKEADTKRMILTK